jgi:fatty acid desaturase
VAKQKRIEDMTPEEKLEWLDQYLADMPKRQAERDRFVNWAVISMSVALIAIPALPLIAVLIEKITKGL